MYFKSYFMRYFLFLSQDIFFHLNMILQKKKKKNFWTNK